MESRLEQPSRSNVPSNAASNVAGQPQPLEGRAFNDVSHDGLSRRLCRRYNRLDDGSSLDRYFRWELAVKLTS